MQLVGVLNDRSHPDARKGEGFHAVSQLLVLGDNLIEDHSRKTNYLAVWLEGAALYVPDRLLFTT
jgi:hypothetical protein